MNAILLSLDEVKSLPKDERDALTSTQIQRNIRHAEFIRLRAERRAARRNAKHDARFNPIRGLDRVTL